jgi:GPH family glycoside/pentoside/hexuronide:cation symporter
MFLLNAAMSAISTIAFLSIMPDAADEHEHQFGNRRQALYFAGWSFATKAATGLGVLIAGLVPQLVEFPNELSEPVAAIAVPDQTASLLALAQGPGVGLLPIFAVLLILLYRIDKRNHARIIEDLSARR